MTIRKLLSLNRKNFVIDWVFAIILSGYTLSTIRWECLCQVLISSWSDNSRHMAGCPISHSVARRVWDARVPGFSRVCSPERVQSVTHTYRGYPNYSPGTLSGLLAFLIYWKLDFAVEFLSFFKIDLINVIKTELKPYSVKYWYMLCHYVD